VTTPRQLSLDVLAQLSGQVEAGCYRYLLWRTWGTGRRVLFIMLNPSTANATEDDQTIRRCRAFARAWGFDGMDIVNIFALRSTDPAALYAHRDPIGPLNDTTITDAARRCGRVVCAWGHHGKLLARGSAVLRLLWDLGVKPMVLGLTARLAQPRHPLYLRRDVELFYLLREPPLP